MSVQNKNSANDISTLEAGCFELEVECLEWNLRKENELEVCPTFFGEQNVYYFISGGIDILIKKFSYHRITICIRWWVVIFFISSIDKERYWPFEWAFEFCIKKIIIKKKSALTRYCAQVTHSAKCFFLLEDLGEKYGFC